MQDVKKKDPAPMDKNKIIYFFIFIEFRV